jgi:hypothetical protein
MDKQYRDAYMKAARHQFGFKPLPVPPVRRTLSKQDMLNNHSSVAPNMRQLGKPLSAPPLKQAQPFPPGFGLVRPGVLAGKKK